jgi:hypothetical protein
MTPILLVPLAALLTGLAGGRWRRSRRRDDRSIAAHRDTLGVIEHVAGADDDAHHAERGASHVRIIAAVPAAPPRRSVAPARRSAAPDHGSEPLLPAHPPPVGPRPGLLGPAHPRRESPPRQAEPGGELEAAGKVARELARLVRAPQPDSPAPPARPSARSAPPPHSPARPSARSAPPPHSPARPPAPPAGPVVAGADTADPRPPADRPAASSGPAEAARSARRPTLRPPTRRAWVTLAAGVAAAAAAGGSIAWSESAPPGRAASPRIAPAAAPAPTVAPPPSPTTVPPPLVAQSVSAAGATYAVRSLPLELDLTLVGPCWAELRSGSPEGPLLFEGTLTAGSHRTWSVLGGLFLRLGNPAAARLVVDGSAVSLPLVADPFDLTFDTTA